MASDNFVDYVKIHCTSGNGGGGSTHYRREKYIPLGGPDGGDGGRGGHIVLRGNSQLWTLLHLKYKKHMKAGHGAHGTGQLKTGAQGKDGSRRTLSHRTSKSRVSSERHHSYTVDAAPSQPSQGAADIPRRDKTETRSAPPAPKGEGAESKPKPAPFCHSCKGAHWIWVPKVGQ